MVQRGSNTKTTINKGHDMELTKEEQSHIAQVRKDLGLAKKALGRASNGCRKLGQINMNAGRIKEAGQAFRIQAGAGHLLNDAVELHADAADIMTQYENGPELIAKSGDEGGR